MAMEKRRKQASLYERIYDVIRRIPEGRVATYGQVAGITGGCSARNVGYALSALTEEKGVPWYRVINRKGQISLRSDLGGDLLQRKLLESEGVVFDDRDRVDLNRYGWESGV